MPTHQNHSYDTETQKEVDSLIKEHLADQSESEGEADVAAVSASDRFAWAKEAGVEVEFVDQRLAALCQEIDQTSEKHWAVPRFRLRDR